MKEKWHFTFFPCYTAVFGLFLFPAMTSFHYYKRLGIYHSVDRHFWSSTDLKIFGNCVKLQTIPVERQPTKEKDTCPAFLHRLFCPCITKRLKYMLPSSHFTSISVIVFKGTHYSTQYLTLPWHLWYLARISNFLFFFFYKVKNTWTPAALPCQFTHIAIALRLLASGHKMSQQQQLDYNAGLSF